MKKLIWFIFLALVALRIEAQSPVSFQVKAGVGMANFYGKEIDDAEAKFAYKVGVGMDYAFNRTWSLQTFLNFVSKGSKGEAEDWVKMTMNELYLELPVMAALRVPVSEKTQLVLSAGPYIACGVGGKTTADIEERKIPTTTGYETIGGKYEADTFGALKDGNIGMNRFDAGLAFGVAAECHRFILGIDAQLGLTDISGDLKKVAEAMSVEMGSTKNISAFFSIGYRF